MKDYTIGKLLGHGGFGDVYNALDDEGNEYAIKYFKQNQPMSQDLLQNVRKRFIKEVRIQKNIKHENIVPILKTSESDELCYLMPKATCSLADELEEDKKGVASRYMAIISDIAAALTYLHSMQIYHRDLKPQNILRFDTHGRIQYKISDFGLISLKESNLSGLTATGMHKGSDFYTAPEITKELSAAVPQTDVYSFACILHDILDDGSRVPCSTIKSETSFSDIFSVATRSDPEKRFPTAKSFVDAVAAVAFSVDIPPVPAFEDIVNKLGTVEEDDKNFWNDVWEAVSSQDEAVLRFVFSKMKEESFKKAIFIAGEAGQKIYAAFCDWVASREDFPFEYCDVLCERIRGSLESVDFERRFKGCYALLCLGTSHNRWFVERCFMAALAPEIDDAFAKRASIEIRVLDKDICSKIEHLRVSIDADVGDLHPVVAQAIKDICS